MMNADQNREKLVRLRKLLIASFDLEELRILCFDLGLDYEDLAGKTKTTKMQDLITYLQRLGELQRLLDEVNSQRTSVDWPEFAPTIEDKDADNYTDDKTGLEMIRIPAGEFIYGGDNRLELLDYDYWISKTPVTNAQYFRFFKYTEQNPPEHWEGKSPKAEIVDHPVVYVSWRDVKAYADWADMDLPTAEEWEKAARGTDGLVYPWGNDWLMGYCNTFASGIDTTTPVGQYSPQGDSPYGCVDMAGNVWEWTASWAHEEMGWRGVRGGSWYHPPSHASSAYRYFPHPAARGDVLGFRLVVRRPPSK